MYNRGLTNPITVEQVKKMLDQKEDVIVIDIRQQFEKRLLNVGGMHIVSSQLARHIPMLKKDYSNHTIVIACKGYMTRAKHAQSLLRKNGIEAKVLIGGISKWGATYRNTKLPLK